MLVWQAAAMDTVGGPNDVQTARDGPVAARMHSIAPGTCCIERTASCWAVPCVVASAVQRHSAQACMHAKHCFNTALVQHSRTRQQYQAAMRHVSLSAPQLASLPHDAQGFKGGKASMAQCMLCGCCRVAAGADRACSCPRDSKALNKSCISLANVIYHA
jgi:hypothetical protein